MKGHHQIVVSVLSTDDTSAVSFFSGEFVVANQKGGHQDDFELLVFAGFSLGVLKVAFLSAQFVVDQNLNGHQ
jgi:hypothetical protein